MVVLPMIMTVAMKMVVVMTMGGGGGGWWRIFTVQGERYPLPRVSASASQEP